MICPLCSNPLGELEESLNRKWHFECERCSFCNGEMPNSEVIEKAISDGAKPIHTGCLEQKLDKELKDGVPLTYDHLDRLNRLMLSRRPENLLSLESLYELLRSMQQCTANISIAISRQRDKTRIREAENYRAHVEIESENIKASKRSEEEKKQRRIEEKADPRIRERRKAIEGLLAIGISKEVAETMIPPIKAN